MTIYELKQSKLGMTLVEMVISLVILSILVTSTMGMIVSTNSLFISTSKGAVDKLVGNSVFDLFEALAKYSTSMKIADHGTSKTDTYAQAFVLNETQDDNTDKTTGEIWYQSKNDTEPVSLYSVSFYGGRSVRYKFEKVGTDNKHVKITVEVYREGKCTYSRSAKIKCVNLGLLSSGQYGNFIDDSEVTDYELYNQDLYFECNEDLLPFLENALNVEYKVEEFLQRYNEILQDYFDDLQAIFNNIDLGSNADNQRIQVEDLQDMINGRTYAIFGATGARYTSNDYVYPTTEQLGQLTHEEYVGQNFKDSSKVNNLRAYYQSKIYDLLKFMPDDMYPNEEGSMLANQTLISGKNYYIADHSGNPYYGVVATKEELYLGFLFNYYDDGETDANGNLYLTEDEYPHFDETTVNMSSSAFFDSTIFETDGYDDAMVMLGYFIDGLSDSYTDKLIKYSGTSQTQNVQFYETKGERLHGYNWAGSFAAGWEGSSEFKIDGSLGIASSDYNYSTSSIKSGETKYTYLGFSLSQGEGSLTGKSFGDWSAAKNNHSENVAWGLKYTSLPGSYKYNVLSYVQKCTGSISYYNYPTPSKSGDTLTFAIPTSLTTSTVDKYDNTSFRVYSGRKSSSWPSYDHFSSYTDTTLSDQFAGTEYTVVDNLVWKTSDVVNYWKWATIVGYDVNKKTFTSADTNLIGMLGAENIETYADVTSASGTANVSSGTYSNHDSTNVTTLKVRGNASVKEGWYYYLDDERDDVAVHFFYLKANNKDYDPDQTTPVNAENIAVAAGNTIELYTKSYKLRYVRYQQAEYYMTDDMSGSGTDQYNANIRIYTLVQPHQYTDWMLYGVDWGYWFGDPANGLLNLAINGAVNTISEYTGWLENCTTITQVSKNNASRVLGNTCSLSLNTISLKRSYNNAWLIYNQNRSTWYYLPSGSSRVSTWFSNKSWYSSGDTPTALNLEKYGGSSGMMSSIDTNQINTSVMFGLGTTQSDVIWVALPSTNTVGTPNAALTDLSISGVSLSPQFDSDTVSYTGSLGSGVATSTVSATTSDSKATVTVLNYYTENDEDKTKLCTGGVVEWHSGKNIVQVVVTDTSMNVVKRYTITVTKS